MKIWKKSIAIVMAVTMLGGMLTACGEATNSSGSESSAEGSSKEAGTPVEESNLNEPGVFPILKEKETITLGIPQSPNVEDYDTNELTLLLEEKGNMDINFVMFPSAYNDAVQKLQLLVSSQQELPELLIGLGSLNASEILNYGSKGVFLNLNDYYENSSQYIKQGLDQLQSQGIDLLRLARSSDGNLYGVPRFQQELGNSFETKAWINQKWLDAVGKPIPTTTDELYEVLKLFANEDPNGNGKKDEIPMAGCVIDWGSTPHDYLENAFVYTDSGISTRGDYRMYRDNGTIKAAYAQDAWKDGLLYMSKLVKEGLLSPLSYTQDAAQYKQMVFGTGINAVGVYVRGGLIHPQEDESKLEYVALPPLKGPNGVQYACYSAPKPDAYAFITKYAKNPEAIFRLLDYMWSEECTMQSRYGTEGKGWAPAGEGDIGTYSDIPVKFKELPLWGKVNNQHWSEQNITFRPRSISDAGVLDPANTSRAANIAAANEYSKYQPDDVYVPKLVFSEDEIAEVGDIIVTLNSYVEESTARFITGDMDVEKEWESYLAELENIGLPRLLEASQAAYDRMYS